MHITVNGGNGPVDGRTRAYVEYRVFDTLRPIEREIRAVDVSLTDRARGGFRGTSCAIVLELTTGERIDETANAEWPYAAIDAAVRKASSRVPYPDREVLQP